ncbi:hypothetical protein HanIR_Chr05g0217601 [Helianthus annuus]|nr:hypothetical protein HanIR_Chr05g0217601 [Helianthus annuus]
MARVFCHGLPHCFNLGTVDGVYVALKDHHRIEGCNQIITTVTIFRPPKLHESDRSNPKST